MLRAHSISEAPFACGDLSSTLQASETIALLFVSAVTAGAFRACVSLRVNKGAYIRRAPPGFYVRRDDARARGVLEVFPAGAAGPDPAAAATAAATAVPTGSRLGRPAQPLQADLPGPEQSADSHSGRQILVRIRRRRRRRRVFSPRTVGRPCSFPRVTGGSDTWLGSIGHSTHLFYVYAFRSSREIILFIVLISFYLINISVRPF